MGRQLGSVEHFEDAGKVVAACGHRVDVRSLVFVHLFKAGIELRIETSCAKCAEGLPDYIHVKRVHSHV